MTVLPKRLERNRQRQMHASARLVLREPIRLQVRNHPGGMSENSPAFQRWGRAERTASPEGTADLVDVSRPFGTYRSQTSNPTLKRWAIVVCPSGTPSSLTHSCPSNAAFEKLRPSIYTEGRGIDDRTSQHALTPALSHRMGEGESSSALYSILAFHQYVYASEHV